MFCPDCGAEYRPEIHECAECQVVLVPALPAEAAVEPNAKIVPVFRTTDPMILPIVTSLIESAGIEYFVQGEEALGLVPIGAMAGNVSRASIGAIVHVHDEDAASVREMLAEIKEGAVELPADVTIEFEAGAVDIDREDNGD